MFKYAIGIFAVLSFSFGYFFVTTLKRRLRALPNVKTKLIEIGNQFESLKKRFDDDSQYLRFSKLEIFEAELLKLKDQLRELDKTFLRNKIKEKLNEVIDFENNLALKRAMVNDLFFQKEAERAKDIFYDKNGSLLLTEEQIKAVLCDDDRNLIIAGAGSGKTRVIDFKVRYLVKHKKINPSKIVLLSFSRKSAGDLVKKISENVPGIEARTIHSFSSQAIGRNEKKLFDENSKELNFFVIKALAETLKEKVFLSLFFEFYDKYFSDIKPLIFYKSLNELREDLKKNNSKLITNDSFAEIKAKRTLRTLRGEYVRSIDERYIADFLYLQGINYEYEKKYPYSKRPYYPDFYLVDYDLYLEHFAITSTGFPPSWFDDPQGYMDGIDWKREQHEGNNTRMLESYSYLLNEGKTSAYLGKLLFDAGVKVDMSFEDENAYAKISSAFSQFFIKFYNSYKLSGLSVNELKKSFPGASSLLFLRLFEKFLHHYEKLIQDENKMDFSDMIIAATKKYQNKNDDGFDYIIVDEFQDTSNLAMKLLNNVYQSNPNSAFMCVGDDWQSIYGFNGSDVSILSEYETSYPGVSVQKLNSNFRSHSRIVDLGKRFISKNPAQISKDVVSQNREFKESVIDFLSFELMEEKIRSIPDNESIFVLYRYNDDCPVGQGIFKEFFYLDRNRKPVKVPSCTKNISLMTIHGSKGLEARHVFVLFPDGVSKKFPSDIEDHFVFNMLKTNSDPFPFSEERRLMYVAITRAEQNLYFVSSRKSNDPNSVFWDELRELVTN